MATGDIDKYDHVTCDYCGCLCGENSFILEEGYFTSHYCSEYCAKADLLNFDDEALFRISWDDYRDYVLKRVDYHPDPDEVKRAQLDQC